MHNINKAKTNNVEKLVSIKRSLKSSALGLNFYLRAVTLFLECVIYLFVFGNFLVKFISYLREFRNGCKEL